MNSRPLHVRGAATVAFAAAAALTFGAVALAQAGPGSPPVSAPGSWGDRWDSESMGRYDACIAKTRTDPETAFEDAHIFHADGGGALARHCIALALLELGAVEEAALRLEQTAFMPDGGDSAMRAELLSQAGNAWLLARAPIEAEQAFTQAMTIQSGDPDLFIDRARAHALQSHFGDAASDLSVALTLRPQDVLALRLRADAHFELGQLDQAESDVDAALRITPRDVDTLVLRGRIREARRLGWDAARDPGAADPSAAPDVLPDAPAL